jgi:hypothetical protein
MAVLSTYVQACVQYESSRACVQQASLASRTTSLFDVNVHRVCIACACATACVQLACDHCARGSHGAECDGQRADVRGTQPFRYSTALQYQFWYSGHSCINLLQEFGFGRCGRLFGCVKLKNKKRLRAFHQRSTTDGRQRSYCRVLCCVIRSHTFDFCILGAICERALSQALFILFPCRGVP